MQIFYVCLYRSSVDKINFIPAKDRANPYQMEIVFRLFANSVTKINYSFERAFLKWTEYPPDANHGFYVSSAVISTVLPVASQFTSTPQSASLMEERSAIGHCTFYVNVSWPNILEIYPKINLRDNTEGGSNSAQCLLCGIFANFFSIFTLLSS